MRNSRGCKGHIRISKVHIVPHLLGIYRELIEYKAPCEPPKILGLLAWGPFGSGPSQGGHARVQKGPQYFRRASRYYISLTVPY